MDNGETVRKAETDGVAERVSATDARDRLTELMNRARFAGERFVITRNDEPLALIIGAQELDRLPLVAALATA
jgi:prevent-host-death family protein